MAENETEPKKSVPAALEDREIPQVAMDKTVKENEAAPINHKEREVVVKTDVFNATLDMLGGDIVHLVLPEYAEDQKSYGDGYVLFAQSPKRYYVAQSGLAGEQGPDRRGVGRAKYQADANEFQLAADQDELIVDLKTKATDGVNVIKRFHFYRGSYAIDVEYLIYNLGSVDYKGNFYARLKRKPDAVSGGGFLGIQTFTGAAIHTEDTPYKKISFKDIAEKPLDQVVKGGWAAMVEHYFVAAWIPGVDNTSTYQTSKLDNDIYSVGLIEPAITVAPGEEKSIKSKLYAGPEITEDLEKLAPGLEHAVDYGILWPICQPIFWLLKKAFQFSGNWGVAIILTTILIKLLFYKL